MGIFIVLAHNVTCTAHWLKVLSKMLCFWSPRLEFSCVNGSIGPAWPDISNRPWGVIASGKSFWPSPKIMLFLEGLFSCFFRRIVRQNTSKMNPDRRIQRSQLMPCRFQHFLENRALVPTGAFPSPLQWKQKPTKRWSRGDIESEAFDGRVSAPRKHTWERKLQKTHTQLRSKWTTWGRTICLIFTWVPPCATHGHQNVKNQVPVSKWV